MVCLVWWLSTLRRANSNHHVNYIQLTAIYHYLLHILSWFIFAFCPLPEPHLGSIALDLCLWALHMPNFSGGLSEYFGNQSLFFQAQLVSNSSSAKYSSDIRRTRRFLITFHHFPWLLLIVGVGLPVIGIELPRFFAAWRAAGLAAELSRLCIMEGRCIRLPFRCIYLKANPRCDKTSIH